MMKLMMIIIETKKILVKYLFLFIGLISLIILNISCNNIKNESLDKCPETGKKYEDSIYVRFCNKIDHSVFDLEKAKLKAKESKKHILAIFNSFYCVNCRKFEDRILFNSEVRNYIDDNFILATFFVDDWTSIQTNQISKFTKKEIKSIGALNIELQLSLTQQGSNPAIVILNSKGEPIGNGFQGKENSIKEFKDWLDKCVTKH